MEPIGPPTAQVTTDELGRLGVLVQHLLPAYLEDLATLVNIDCGSYTRAGVDQVGRWTGRFLERLGGDVTFHPGGELGHTVVGVIDAPVDAPRFLLIGHLDTVFPEGTAAARPYRTEDGRAYGPGVTDMKSGLLSGLYAMLAVRGLLESSGGSLPFGLTFVANPDEEIGSPVSTPFIRDLAAHADACFVLECARENGDIVSGRKGIVDLRLTVAGRAAHAGVEPERGRSAILESARLIQAIHALNGRWPGVTANVGVIAGGTRPNVVPERAILEVDVRAVSREHLVAAEAAIDALIATPGVPDTTITAEVMGRHWPMERLERAGRLVAHVQAIGERLGFAVRDTLTGGASDANTTAGMGVPTLDGLGPIGGNDHAPGEYLDLRSIVPRTTLLAALLLEAGRDPEIRRWRAGGTGRTT